MGARYWDAQCLVVYFTFKETKFCSVYAVRMKFSWFEFANRVSWTKLYKQLTQASTDCIERKFAFLPHCTSRKGSTRMQIKQEAARYCMDLQNELDVACYDNFLVIKTKWERQTSYELWKQTPMRVLCPAPFNVCILFLSRSCFLSWFADFKDFLT